MRTATTTDERPSDLEGIEALILDLDGVVTDTARTHAAAWKRAFDQFLRQRSERTGEPFVPFDAEEDYLRYVDGKPRSDGVRDFLASRGISLPHGEANDPPYRETVRGLGNRKDQYFLQLLETRGVDAYPSTVELVRRMSSRGVRSALVSASRNARRVLRAAGLSGLFEVVVDGVEAERLGLRGKPDPDMFLEAARRLGVRPERAAVVEDALAGVEAGRAGGFGTVIGVDRRGLGKELRAHGADIVVGDLADLAGEEAGTSKSALPSALGDLEGISRRLREGIPAVFLDYDGTLSPIVEDPGRAVISDRARAVVADLARRCLVAVVSGRDLADVRARVGLSELIYVGSHGYEVMWPGGTVSEQAGAGAFLSSLDSAERALTSAVEGIAGARVERKRFALALHYRQVAEADLPRLEAAFDEVSRQHRDLRRGAGKKVLELRPDMDWDKGRMVLSLLARSHVDGTRAVPLYIGDDLTDEDAFRAIDGNGVTVLVGDHGQATAAQYSLADVPEVVDFLDGLVERFDREVAGGIWKLVYEGFLPEKEKLREAICSLGNGYMASRGAAPESRAGDHHYPGTYLAGAYDRLVSRIDGRTLENESIFNIPNWLCLSFRVNGGNWFDLETVDILGYRQELDMRSGILTRVVRFSDREGRRTCVKQRRLVSMASPHLAALETIILPEDWSGRLEVRSALDGRVENGLVERYRQLNNRHLRPAGAGTAGDEIVWLRAETVQSHNRVAEAARTRVFADGKAAGRAIVHGQAYIGHEVEVEAEEGRPVRVEKVVAIYSSRDRAISEPALAAVEEVRQAAGFEELHDAHSRSWEALWQRYRIEVDAAHDWIAQTLNLHVFHLLQTASVHSVDLDVGIPPRGLSGEAYRGLIMWDEVFVFPFLNLRAPDIARSLLLYRYRRLPRARWAARQAGHEGAMFPWQSGSDGREEGQTWHLNPMSGTWVPDHTQLERHIGLAIAYNVWQYYQVTGDIDFMSSYGGELLVEIARFWASLAQYNPERGRYEVRGVMGPDEFHEKYPGAAEAGIDNNAYTNVMAAWTMARALDAVRLPVYHHRDLREALAISDRELERWEDISRRMYVPFHDGVISQFQGYDELEELDMAAYGRRYCNIHRLDRILKAEGDTPDRYKVSKQADVLMLFYLFSPGELAELFARLGYELDEGTISRTIDYYAERTCHGSTLSRVVHAWVLSRRDRELSWNLFLEALRSDISDIQGGTTHEGIHLGAMASTVDLLQRCYSGLETRGGTLWFDPCLPAGLDRVHFDIEYRHHLVEVEIERRLLRLTSRAREAAPVRVEVRGKLYQLLPGEVLEVDLAGGADGTPAGTSWAEEA